MFATLSIDSLRAEFDRILPTLQRHACFTFRRIPCEQTRNDRIAETLAYAWRQMIVLAQRSIDVTAFPATFALRCSQAVKAGRRVGGSETLNDVMSPTAQRRRGFSVGSLSEDGERALGPVGEALVPSGRRSPATQACFRIDFAEWRGRYGKRDRRLIDDLGIGERTKDLAVRHRLTPGRISQRRREFLRDWLAFHGKANGA